MVIWLYQTNGRLLLIQTRDWKANPFSSHLPKRQDGARRHKETKKPIHLYALRPTVIYTCTKHGHAAVPSGAKVLALREGEVFLSLLVLLMILCGNDWKPLSCGVFKKRISPSMVKQPPRIKPEEHIHTGTEGGAQEANRMIWNTCLTRI